MTALPLSELPEIVATRIKAVLPDLATCKGITGRLDLDEVQRNAFATPAVLVSRIRIDHARTLGGPHRVYRVMMAAFVLTKDTLGLPRDVAATNIAQVIMQLLPDCRFGRAEFGPAEKISEEPIATTAVRKAGIGLSAITWEQDLALDPLPENQPMPVELYVQAHLTGVPTELWQITGENNPAEETTP